MQRAGVIFDDVKTLVTKGMSGQAITLTNNKSEVEEKPQAITTPLPKPSSAAKLLTLKDILNYEEFDLACANELAELCNSPERWTSSEPPFAYHFLKNKLDVYQQHLECATKINADLDNKLNFDANHIALKSLLRSRIESLKKIIIEYQDCLYERSLALGGMVRLESTLQVKVKNAINEFKPTEYFSDAIFVCHSGQWLSMLTLAELATMLEKHGQCGVNAVAGVELSKIIIRELINRVVARTINCFDPQLRRIQTYLDETVPILGEQLHMGICKVICDLLEAKQLNPTGPALLEFIKVAQAQHKPSFDKLCETVRDIIMLQVHGNELSVYSEEVRRMFECLQGTKYHQQLVKSVSAKVIDDLCSHKLDVNTHAGELRGMLNYFEVHDQDCFRKLKQMVDEHTNHKANAFRKIYKLLYGIVHHPFKSNYLSNKEALSGEELIKDINGVGRANPMVTFVWELIQRYYPDITEKNAALFKEIYKAKFNFSYFSLSRIAGSFFWGASENLTRTVDALTDKQISEFRALDGSTCRATIYRGLCKLS